MITGTLLAFFHLEAPAKTSHPAGAGLTFAVTLMKKKALLRSQNNLAYETTS